MLLCIFFDGNLQLVQGVYRGEVRLQWYMWWRDAPGRQTLGTVSTGRRAEAILTPRFLYYIKHFFPFAASARREQWKYWSTHFSCLCLNFLCYNPLARIRNLRL